MKMWSLLKKQFIILKINHFATAINNHENETKIALRIGHTRPLNVQEKTSKKMSNYSTHKEANWLSNNF